MKYKRGLYRQGEITWNDVKASVISWVGQAGHADAEALVRKVLWDLVLCVF